MALPEGLTSMQSIEAKFIWTFSIGKLNLPLWR
jgi:hypothetical protein